MAKHFLAILICQSFSLNLLYDKATEDKEFSGFIESVFRVLSCLPTLSSRLIKFVCLISLVGILKSERAASLRALCEVLQSLIRARQERSKPLVPMRADNFIFRNRVCGN